MYSSLNWSASFSACWKIASSLGERESCLPSTLGCEEKCRSSSERMESIDTPSFFSRGSDNAVLLPRQRFEQMLRLQLCAFQGFRPPLGNLQRFLNLKGEFI